MQENRKLSIENQAAQFYKLRVLHLMSSVLRLTSYV